MLKRVLLAGVCPVLLFLFSCKVNNEPQPQLQYHADGEVSQLMKSNLTTAVNVVIIGDGYQKADLLTNGAFDIKAKEVSDYLFTTPPFSSYKDYFNVYKVYAESESNNISDNPGNTKFSTFFNPMPNLASNNITLAKEYAQKAVPNGTVNVIILLSNNDQPANGGNNNLNMITSADGSLSILLHRLGHSFAGLGDEYISPETYATVNKNLLKTYPNLDATADPTKVKWAQYIKNSAYKSAIGVYEGGFYVAKGVYRPEGNSVMLNTATCSSYNAPSREAIARVIFKITGLPFDQADFLEKDKSAIQPRLITGPQTTTNPATNYPPGMSY